MNKLSVIMTTYNEDAHHLKKCIDSVLGQTFSDFQFIIVIEPNERNKEYLMQMADADKRLSVLENERREGKSESRNKAVIESDSDLIAIMDGDDYCDERRFEKQVSFLEDHPEIGIVGSNMHLIDIDGNVFGERRYPEDHYRIRKAFLIRDPLANPTLIIRKSIFQENGFFDPKFPAAEDFELLLRFLAQKVRMHNLQENLLYYRVRPDENRGREFWQCYYLARREQSKFLWPFYRRFPVLSGYFLLAHMPNILLSALLKLLVVNKLRSINKVR
ncbi:glycosyltransferase family 2 protein [Fibrobacterota bacterium]